MDAFLMGEGDSAGRLKIAKSLVFEDSLAMVLIATVFSLFAAFKNSLLCFGFVSVQSRPVIKLGYDLTVAMATPAVVFLAAMLLGGTNLWFGFALTPLLLSSYVLAVNAAYCRKDRNMVPFYLFNKINDVVALDVSLDYSMDNIAGELARIRAFLGICEIGDTLEGKIELCCEELMVNIREMHARSSTYNLRLSDCEDCISLVVKNLGHPVSPVINNGIANDFLEKGTIPDSRELSLFCILHSCDKVDYRYVYGINVMYLSFSKK